MPDPDADYENRQPERHLKCRMASPPEGLAPLRLALPQLAERVIEPGPQTVARLDFRKLIERRPHAAQLLRFHPAAFTRCKMGMEIESRFVQPASPVIDKTRSRFF